MRLLQLTGYTGPYAGSFVPMLRASMRAARARGFGVEAIAPEHVRDREWLPELDADGLRVRFMPAGSRRALGARLREVLEEGRGESTVLHSHFTTFDVPAVLAARRDPRAAVLWHIHTPPRPGLAVRARNLIKYAGPGRAVASILCVAPNIAEAVARDAPAGKAVFFPNAIDLERFQPPSPEERAAARERLGLPSDRAVVLHFGWDWHRKGGDLFLEATERLNRGGGAPVVAVTVGGGDKARRLGSRRGLGDALRIVEPTGDVRSLHAVADVFVSASRAEGMPFAVAEALASGVPVVATRIPGHLEIGAGIACCRITGHDATEIAVSVRELLDRDPATAEREAEEGRRRLSDAMGLDAWAERLVDRYASLAAGA